MKDRELIGRICDAADNTAASASAMYLQASRYQDIQGILDICEKHAEGTLRRVRELKQKQGGEK